MERRYINCDPEVCTGCQLCEFACAAAKQGEFNLELSRIKLVRIKSDLMMSVACRFCEDTPCIAACPREALSWDEERGIIVLDKVRCTGCGWCLEACDFGAISLNPASKLVEICDLCENEEEGPLCVKWCSKEALSLATSEMVAQKARRGAVALLLQELTAAS